MEPVMEKNYRDLIKETNIQRKEEYIKYFFANIVGTDLEPIYDKEDETGALPFYISIVKNSQEKQSKRGNKYVERYWRTCVFCFIDRELAYDYLNDSGKENYCFPENSDIISWTSSNGFKSNKVNSEFAESVNCKLFKYLKVARSSWFVRSYVYIVLIICDKDTPISSKDFYVNYWNNNYAFKKAGKTQIFGKSKNITFAEDVQGELTLIKDENKDSIDCVAAYYGRLDYYHENEEAYSDIKCDVDSGVEYILCQGAARTGKTVLAMRLLCDYPQFKLLLLNYNFYLSLKDAFLVQGATFPSSRIFHHDLKHQVGCWIKGRINKTLNVDLRHFIVDEAQRLGTVKERITTIGRFSSIDEIRIIVDCKGHVQTVFFGDDSQRLNPNYDQGFAKIKTSLAERDYREYYFREPLGVPAEVIKNVRFLLGFDNSEPCFLNQFSMSVIKDPNAFINEYDNNLQKKKHLVVPMIGDERIELLNIGPRSFRNYKNSESPRYLFNSNIQDSFFLTAYSVISREIESVYLYIPSHIYLDNNSVIQTKYLADNTFIINHLYTIMTRSTMALTICCEDEKLAEYLNEKIETIKSLSAPIEPAHGDAKADYDIFVSYFGTEKETGTYKDAKRICDVLKKQGLNVFLFAYSCNKDDEDLLFSETWHAISRSSSMIFVFNENVEKDDAGLIKRKEDNGEISRIYQELNRFEELISQGDRTAKSDARFYYSGTGLNKYTVYPFLNRYIPPLTQGNSKCCFMNDDEMIAWVKDRFPNNEN